MADVFTKAKRSEVMSRIRSRGNRDTELALARRLGAHGLTGWRRHIQVRIVERGTRNSTSPRPSPQSGAGGFRTPRSALRVFTVRPDFLFPKRKLAVFVDGCFWHACPKHATKPKNNAAFWRKKLAANQARDRKVNRMLRRAGWCIVRIWECDLAKRPGVCLHRIQRALERRRSAFRSRSESAAD